MFDDPRLNKTFMPISSFDPNLLPEGKRDPESPDYGLWIQEHLTEELSGLGVNALIIVGPEQIEIEWSSDGDVDLVDKAIDFLQKGNYERGIRMLRTVQCIDPDNEGMLFNLGMALSDMKELDEAIQLLRRLVELTPESANAYVSLGVAQARQGKPEDAVASLEEACRLEPENSFAHRNLGSILTRLGRTQEAIDHLRKATQMSSEDPAAWFGLGQALMEEGDSSDADAAFRKVLEIAPGSEVSEAARSMLTKLAEFTMRKRGVGGERPDAVMYCLGALEKFANMSDDQVKPIMIEIAIKGQEGFDINDPEKRYSFNSIQGDFSGLQAVCYMYVAMQRLMPGQDAGIDLSDEYKQAKSLFKE